MRPDDRDSRCLLGFGGLGGSVPDQTRGLGVEQLVPEAAADQVGPLGQVEHPPLSRHCDAASLHTTHHIAPCQSALVVCPHAKQASLQQAVGVALVHCL